MGQVNLVRFGVNHLSEDGVFVLTSGIFSQRPIPGVPALAMANGGVESFTRGAARSAGCSSGRAGRPRSDG
jgi:hypothetical protein